MMFCLKKHYNSEERVIPFLWLTYSKCLVHCRFVGLRSLCPLDRSLLLLNGYIFYLRCCLGVNAQVISEYLCHSIMRWKVVVILLEL